MRVIAITGYDLSLLFQAQELGDDMAFANPFSMVDLVDAVDVLSQVRSTT